MNLKENAFIENLIEGRKQTLAIFGTSLSYHLAPVVRMSFQSVFGELVSVVNSGLAGRASRTGLASLYSRVLRHQPDALLLEWAVNDAHDYAHEPDALDAGISLNESRANLNVMISGVQTALPECEIVLWTTNPTFDAPDSSMRGASARPELEGYYHVVREVASARGLRLLDGENFWNSLRQRDEDVFRALIPDGVHPTPRALRQHLVPFLMRDWGVPVKTS